MDVILEPSVFVRVTEILMVLTVFLMGLYHCEES